MASSSTMKPPTVRAWPVPAGPAAMRTSSIASVAYATEERASEERTASPVRLDSRSDSRSCIESGRPTSTRLIARPLSMHDLESERSEEHTSELQSHLNLVCRLLLDKKNNQHHP